MARYRLLALLVGLIAAGAPFMLGSFRAAGQEAGPSYLGSSKCAMCHKGTHAQIIESFPKTDHASAFWAVASAPAGCQILGDFSSNTQFKQSDVAYVLGKGSRQQAYLDADLKVLPLQWNVAQKAWEPPVNWDPSSKEFKPAPGADAKTECLGCHTTGYDPATANYSEAGVECEACHGPGSAHMAAAGKGNIVNPAKLTAELRAQVCGECHSVGRSPDGKYAFPVGFKPGDKLADHFKMDIPTKPGRNQQYPELTQSKHLAAGTVCATCHEDHGVKAVDSQLRKPQKDLCTGCHPKLPDPPHSAGVIAAVKCSTCHMPGGMHTFSKSKMGS